MGGRFADAAITLFLPFHHSSNIPGVDTADRVRKLVLIALLALGAPAAAFALPHDHGDGSLVVKDAAGKVSVQAGKGFIGGRLADGKLYIFDPNPFDARVPEVFNASKTVQKSGFLTVYQGTNLRFRFVAPRFAVRIVGTGIDLSAVGQGKVTIEGDATVVEAGQFSVDGAPFQDVAPTSALPFTGAFGRAATATTTTTTTTATTTTVAGG